MAWSSADFLALNPFGKVPTLVDGELVLWESNAILIYVSEAHGGFRLWSQRPRHRAELLRWLFWESAHWQPALTQVLGPHAGHVMVPAFMMAPTGAPQWNAPALMPLLTHLEQRLNEHPYLAGSEPTLADFSIVAMTRVGSWSSRVASCGGVVVR